MNPTSLPSRLVGMAHPTCPRRRAATGALLGALALTALGTCALSHPSSPVVQTIPVGHLPDALALDPRAGRAFVANDGDATVSVLDLATRRAVRTVAVGDPNALASPALAVDTRAHHLFVAAGRDNGAPSTVYLLDTRSGVPLATIHVGPEVTALAVDAQHDRVVVATEDGSVSLLDARTGAVVRMLRLDAAPVAVAVDARAARAFVLDQPLQGGYEETDAAQVSTIDTRSGVIVHAAEVGTGATAIAVDSRTARVFVANGGDDTVSVLDAHSGAVLRTVTVGWHPAALVVDDRQGRVFVVNAGDGTLSVLDARNGALFRTVAVFPVATSSTVTMPYALAVDTSRARVYVTAWGRLDRVGLPTGNGQLAVLDARDGRVLRMIVVGVAPRAVGVEARSGRILVVSVGGAIRTSLSWMERWRQIVGRAPWFAPPQPAVVLVPGSVQVIDLKG